MPTIDEQIASAGIDKSRPDWRTRLPKPTTASFKPGSTVRAHMKTNKGPIVIRLMPEVAPLHVTSFAVLSGLGFFDGLSFHRVISGFMAQGGCPLGTGTGGPGYRMDGEFAPGVAHDRPGMLASANAGPGTDGGQVFPTFLPPPWLDGKHTIFGVVESGHETLKTLEAAGTRDGRPKEPPSIESVRVEVSP